MKKMMMYLLVGLAVVAVQAGEIVVSWTSNGVLQATGLEPGTSYTLEWASNLQNAFVANDAPFASLIADSNGVGVVEIPMFFRVTGTAAIPDGMVLIPAGTNSGTDPDFGAYSLVVTNAFYMDATEVSKMQWDTVRNWAVNNGYSDLAIGSGKASDHPVHFLNWYDCVKWCNARSEMEGKVPCYTLGGSTYKGGMSEPNCDFNADGYRLPTSLEWEYAARGGLSGKRFPWGDTITHNQANYNSHFSYSYDIETASGWHPSYNDGVYPYTSPVGSFLPNGYGLYDMAGNIQEWCWDEGRYVEYRILRGGYWFYYAVQLRCGDEDENNAGVSSSNIGFRTVCR